MAQSRLAACRRLRRRMVTPVPPSPTAGKLRADGAAASAVQGDVAEEDTWQRAARLARSACGGVDILVSNAAVSHRLPAHELNRAQWDTQLAVNLTATRPVRRAHPAAPGRQGHRRGPRLP